MLRPTGHIFTQLQRKITKGHLLLDTQKWIKNKGLACPSCGEVGSVTVDRKKFITALRRCSNCKLLFRTPTVTEQETEKFYQRTYSESYVTSLPSVETLPSLKKEAFKSINDYSDYIKVLEALGCQKGERLLDFGCSWGYGSWQLNQAGYTVKGYEISKPRCDYAKQHLGLDACSTLAEINGTFDIFFSAHVLEHVPKIKKIIDYGLRLLRPGGLFIAFTPNGSLALRAYEPNLWHDYWGFIHPNLLDEVFYNKIFADFPRLITTSPYPLDELKTWDITDNRGKVTALSGLELAVAVRKPTE